VCAKRTVESKKEGFLLPPVKISCFGRLVQKVFHPKFATGGNTFGLVYHLGILLS
jgi:hypothetical protein